MSDELETDRSSIERRRFLRLVGGIGLAWVVGGMYPILRYLGPRPAPDPFGADGRAVVEKVTPADVARPGTGGNGSYGGRGVVVFRATDGSLRAFDSKCTHAGCNVEFQGYRIYCQCHGGTYDLNGKNVAGPPPRPLTPLRVEEEAGVLYVSRAPRTEA